MSTLVALYALAIKIATAIASCAMLAASTLTTFTDRLRISDLVKWEVNTLYTRDSVAIKNTNAAAVAAGGIQVGQPLVNNSGTWEIAQQGQEGTVDGLFLGNDSDRINEALAAGATTAGKYQILVRGPAIINKSVIPTADGDAAAYTMATLLATLLALGITTEVEPTSSAIGTQTT